MKQPQIRFRTESLDSKDSPKLLKNEQINNENQNINTKNENQRYFERKVQLIKNLAPIERPHTTKNSKSLEETKFFNALFLFLNKKK